MYNGQFEKAVYVVNIMQLQVPPLIDEIFGHLALNSAKIRHHLFAASVSAAMALTLQKASLLTFRMWSKQRKDWFSVVEKIAYVTRKRGKKHIVYPH